MELQEDPERHDRVAEQIQEICMDMVPRYIRGAQRNIPQPEITFDKVHIMKDRQRGGQRSSPGGTQSATRTCPHQLHLAEGSAYLEGLFAGLIATVVVAAACFVLWRIQDRAVPELHTRYQSGSHLTFVLVAPTAVPSDDYVTELAAAKAAMTQFADENGLLFSTVGISLDWSVEQGADMLGIFGSFDEVVLGRNWLNSGIKRYITDMGGAGAVPQVVLTLQPIEILRFGLSYGDPAELARFIGRDQLLEWRNDAYALNLAEDTMTAAALGGEWASPASSYRTSQR